MEGGVETLQPGSVIKWELEGTSEPIAAYLLPWANGL